LLRANLWHLRRKKLYYTRFNPNLELDKQRESGPLDDEYLEELPDEVEMSPLRPSRGIATADLLCSGTWCWASSVCFVAIKPIVLLEVQLRASSFSIAPGEYFFCFHQVAGYRRSSLVRLCFTDYFICTTRTDSPRAPIGRTSGSGFECSIFLRGWCYSLLAPAALNFFINYGEVLWEQLWSIDRYFGVLLLLFSTEAAFQIPVRFYQACWESSLPSKCFWVGVMSSREHLEHSPPPQTLWLKTSLAGAVLALLLGVRV
jgi:sec-independent protein translocase protein TatC